MPILGAFMFNAIYKIPAYHFACTNVFTTTTLTDAYRGAGRPEATFAIERIMDELAVELGMDPMELREKNWIKHEEFPFTTVAGLTYDSGNYEAATAKAKELFDYDGLRAEQEKRRASGDQVQLGIGISTFTEMCGLAPSRVLGSLDYGAGGWEHAAIRMLPTGKVEVITGASAHGQGHETAWSQIVADQLGVAFEDVEVIHGDTQSSHKGLDTYGSRSLVVGGIAVVKAAEKVVAKAKPIAAHLLECAEDDLEFANGKFTVKGTETSTSMGDVALAVFAAHNLPDGIEPTLDSDATFDPENFSFPHGTHLCAAEVDTETGRIKLRSYVCVDDVGVVGEPADRRGPGARRARAGHRAGAVRRHRARRERHAHHRHVRRLPAAVGGRPAVVHHRPHGDAVDDEPAGRQGSRRSGHDRVDAGGGQRGDRRGAALRRQRHRDAVDPDAGVARHAARHHRRGRPRPRRGRRRARFDRRHWRCAVIPASFDYVRPSTVDEAVQALASAGEDAKVLAGGQSLLPVLRMRLAAPTTLIDLGRVAELRGVREDGDALVIGAMTTHYDVQRDALVAEHAALLKEATDTVADPQVRHRGTFGGAHCARRPRR